MEGGIEMTDMHAVALWRAGPRIITLNIFTPPITTNLLHVTTAMEDTMAVTDMET